MRKTRKTALFGAGCAALLLLASGGCRMEMGDPASLGMGASDYGIPDSKERFAIQRNAIAEKLQTALLPAMRNHGIDMWIVLDRENNEEPLHVELGGGFAGVRGAFIFHDDGSDTVEKLYYSSHEQPANSVIAQIYDETIYYGYSREGLTPHLQKAIEDRDPQTIGVNTSHTLPEADGLTVGLRNFLVDAIGPEYASRIVSAELLVRDFRLQRTPAETVIYTQLLEWTARWMEEALSTENVTTGVTTAEDVSWWLYDRALDLGLTGWGTVRVVREGDLLPIHDPDIPLEPGDVVGIDGGLHYLHYAIDIKRTAYILKPGETEMPESLQEVWRTTHEIGDFYASQMVPGAIGAETWSAINAEMASRGYRAVGPDAGGDAVTTTDPEVGIYGHSVGNVAHDIGARIADDIPFAYGDRVRFPLQANEWVSIEFHVSIPVPEWDGKTWYARFEETAQITEEGVKWLIPTQKELFLIEPAN